MTSNLREKQISVVKQMLNLNTSSSGSKQSEPVWKILVYDRIGQDVLSPILSVKELREAGVTLHVLLHSERENIPDVPAVYFCIPTEDNVDRICRDLQSGLYDIYFLNFLTPIPRQQIEDLASAAYQSNSANTIQKVYDQYLNFICLESDFFVLKHQDSDGISFHALNRSHVKDTEMEAMIDTIVDGLFSVFITLGVVPIIRAPRGNAAEHVAERLDKKIRDNLRDLKNSLFSSDPMSSGQYTLQRPLLIIFDRGMDLTTPLQHTWTYQALAHDVLDLSLNQIKFTDEAVPGPSTSTSRNKGPKARVYDLDDRKDPFWFAHRGSPFPTTAEAIQGELEEYRKAEDDVKRLKATMGLDGNTDLTEIGADMLSDNTEKLTSAITNLPQLLEKKKILDAHTSIATAILKQIKDRKLDTFFELETKLISRAALEKGILDVLLDPTMGLPEDKMRFFLLHYLVGQVDMSKSELEQFRSALESAGCDLGAVEFARKWISYSKMASGIQTTSSTSSSSGRGGASGMLSKLVTGSSFLMEGVRNLVVKRQTLPFTRMTEELMDGKTSVETEDFKYFDPKLLKAPSGSGFVPKATFQEAIVFVVGGGNYMEYQNLIDFSKTKSGSGLPLGSSSSGSAGGAGGGPIRKITYGCTTLTNASHFLKQLSSVGHEMK